MRRPNDTHTFVPYIRGTGQLLNQTTKTSHTTPPLYPDLFTHSGVKSSRVERPTPVPDTWSDPGVLTSVYNNPSPTQWWTLSLVRHRYPCALTDVFPPSVSTPMASSSTLGSRRGGSSVVERDSPPRSPSQGWKTSCSVRGGWGVSVRVQC